MFDTNYFADPRTLFLGAVTGLIFGFLLQKGGVTRFNTIVGQFLLRDFTVLKVMLTAIVVGGVGIYAMLGMGLIDGLHVKTTLLLANVAGGLIFGVGMALLGYCPGTAFAAVGDGSRDALWGILGMFLGVGIFAEVYPWLKTHVLSVGDFGKVTLASATGASPWWFIAALAVVAAGVFLLLERRGQRSTDRQPLHVSVPHQHPRSS